MGFFKKSVSLESKRTALTIIAKGNKISGDMVVTGKLHIDGCVEGSITSIENVSVGKSGKVNGKINAKNITVSGLLEGEVNCDHLHIASGGRVAAVVVSVELTMDGKSQFVGERKECAEFNIDLNKALLEDVSAQGEISVSLPEKLQSNVNSDIIENLPDKVMMASVEKKQDSLNLEKEQGLESSEIKTTPAQIDEKESLDLDDLKLVSANSKLLSELDLSFLDEKEVTNKIKDVEQAAGFEEPNSSDSVNLVFNQAINEYELPKNEMAATTAQSEKSAASLTAEKADCDFNVKPEQAKAKMINENTTKLELKF